MFGSYVTKFTAPGPCGGIGLREIMEVSLRAL